MDKRKYTDKELFVLMKDKHIEIKQENADLKRQIEEVKKIKGGTSLNNKIYKDLIEVFDI